MARNVAVPSPVWVETLGGPLIAIPESVCHHWGGGVQGDFDDWGDYGRACAVSGYLGLIDVGPAKALVLGDAPAPTTFLPELGIFLRWVAADSTADILRAAAEATGTAPWEEELIWEPGEPVVLFDSVLDHDMIAEEKHLLVRLSQGRHTVRAAYVETESVAMVIVEISACA